MTYSRRLNACAGFFSLCLLVSLCACKSPPPAPSSVAPSDPAKLAEMDAAISRDAADKQRKSPPPAPRSAAPFYPAKLAEMDAAISRAVADKKCPGGVLWVEHRGVTYHKAYGQRALVPAPEPMTEDTIFDAASLTKVVACTPAVMLLVERGQVNLDERVQTYIPEFTGEGKEAITVRQLLTHVSGLRGDIETKTDWHGRQTAIEKASAEKLQGAPGTAFRYSDINFFLLGEIVQRVSGRPLEEFVAAGGLSAFEDDGHRLSAAGSEARAHRADGGGGRAILIGAWCTTRPRGRWAALRVTLDCSPPPLTWRVIPECCLTRAPLTGCGSSSRRRWS